MIPMGFTVLFPAPGFIAVNITEKENPGSAGHLLDLYLLTLFISFFLTLFILIKKGILKGNQNR
jgi:hypothetical protein